jgi:hypothetical protein
MIIDNVRATRIRFLLWNSVLLGLLFLLQPSAQAASYGENLIKNGNAEAGPFSNTGAPVAVPSWTTSSAFTVVNYGAPGGFPKTTDPGPPGTDRGNQFFAGGNASISTATQEIDLSANAADINQGNVTYDLSGWLGGYLTDGDNATLAVQFFNGTALIAFDGIGPVTAADRGSPPVTGLFLRFKSAPLPANTTRVVVTLTMTRSSGGGTFNDGYADNLSFVLRAPFVVTTTADSGTGSLRAAIAAGNTITFDPGVFSAASAPHVISLLTALPPLNSNMSIAGPGKEVLAVQHSTASGTPTFSIFVVYNGTVSGPIVALSGLTISKGNANAGGAILASDSALTLDNCAFTDNQSGDSGGGGIYSARGTLTLNNCVVTRNKGGAGAGIHNFRGAVTLNSCAVSGNAASTGLFGIPSGGGGIYNDGGTLMINNSAITGNLSAERAGGIYNGGGGVVTIDKCTVSGNAATTDGGGLMTQGTANITLTNSTLSGNSAGNNGGGVENANSGGTASLTMSNCTLSNNGAGNGGGGIDNFGSGTGAANLKMSNCTFRGNSANAGGGIFKNTAMKGHATVALDNTLFFTAGASGGNIFTNVNGSDNGTITSFGYNMSDDNAGGFFNPPGISSDRINTDPMLGPLQDNGGPTLTHALLPGSLAIDKGNSSLTTDQRGALRPSGNASDIGAFEFQGTPPVVLANISGRLPVETGDNALFAGFIVTGYQPKKVIIRAIGPSLGVAGGLADPTLELRDGSGALLQSNDNWKDSPNKQAIIDSTIPPTNDLESAIVATLPASKLGTGYTAIVRGAGNATGIGVVEVYDLDRSLDSKLANISNRGFVQAGDNVLFAGNIVLGQVSQKVIIRAIGPSLSAVGVSGAMADPTLELHDANGGLLEANDNWVDSPNKQAIIDSKIPPSNDLESAIVRTLAPANYTAIVRGVGNTTGIAVVEVYALN